MPPLITKISSEIGLDNIGYIKTNQKDTRVFDGILLKGKELPKGDREGSLQFVPLKEGVGKRTSKYPYLLVFLVKNQTKAGAM